MSSEVVDFDINRQRLCDFLLVNVINRNAGPILHRFREIAGFLLKTATPPYFTQNFGSCCRSPMLEL